MQKCLSRPKKPAEADQLPAGSSQTAGSAGTCVSQTQAVCLFAIRGLPVCLSDPRSRDRGPQFRRLPRSLRCQPTVRRFPRSPWKPQTEGARCRRRLEHLQPGACVAGLLRRQPVAEPQRVPRRGVRPSSRSSRGNGTRELDYRLIKELWAFTGNRIAVRFAYEYHDDSGNWFRAYGNENWEFDPHGLMRARHASINDLPIAPAAGCFIGTAAAPARRIIAGLTELGL